MAAVAEILVIAAEVAAMAEIALARETKDARILAIARELALTTAVAGSKTSGAAEAETTRMFSMEAETIDLPEEEKTLPETRGEAPEAPKHRDE